MGVKSAIRGAAKTWGDDIAEKKSPNLVLDCVGFVLVECDEDKGLVHKRRVVEKRLKE